MTRNSVPLRIAADHPALAGHFPGHPIVPGVVLLDEVLHAIEAQQRTAGAGNACWRVAVVKFHRVVLPDQTLRLDYPSDGGDTVPFELWAADTRDALVISGTLIATTAPGSPAATASALP